MKTHLLLLLFALAGLTAGYDYASMFEMCKKPLEATRTLSDKMKLPDTYKVSGSITNWVDSTTWSMQETATKEFRVLEKNGKTGKETWIQDMSNGGKDTVYIDKSGECNGNTTRPLLINVPRFSKMIGTNASSFSEIVSNLLKNTAAIKGFLIESQIDVVSGMNSYKWISCVNGTGNETATILEVRYTGEDTITPPLQEFSSPLLLSFRMAELVNFDSTTPKNHWSVELDRYELPTGNEAAIAHGVYCKGVVPIGPKVKDIDEFAATLNYFDYRTNKQESVEVLYSKSRQVFIVAGSSFHNVFAREGEFPNTPREFSNDTDYVLHDFKYGYEVTMSRGACETLAPLVSGTSDVQEVQNDPKDNKTMVLTMSPLASILIPRVSLYAQYANSTDTAGLSYTNWRTTDTVRNVIREIQLNSDMEIHSMNEYTPGTRQLVRTMTVTRVPIEMSRLNMKTAQMSDCYDGGRFSNNTWIVPIKDKNLTDIRKVGLNHLNEAVVNSITKNVYPIIPYRVVTFYTGNHENGVSLVIRLAEKSTVVPGKVSGYNYSDELSTADLFKRMNDAMMAEKMPIEVETIGGGKEEWIADAKAMKKFEPDDDSGFIGYTGGAMFVLAIFCLLIGVSIGSVGVFVVTRRQRISTLAYQVFE